MRRIPLAALIGLFFTDWKGQKKPAPAPADAELLVSPGFVGARGRF